MKLQLSAKLILSFTPTSDWLLTPKKKKPTLKQNLEKKPNQNTTKTKPPDPTRVCHCALTPLPSRTKQHTQQNLRGVHKNKTPLENRGGKGEKNRAI